MYVSKGQVTNFEVKIFWNLTRPHTAHARLLRLTQWALAEVHALTASPAIMLLEIGSLVAGCSPGSELARNFQRPRKNRCCPDPWRILWRVCSPLVSSLLPRHVLILGAIMAFQMETCLHGSMLCLFLTEETLASKRHRLGHIFSGCSEAREKCSSDFWEKRISSVRDILCRCRSCRCQQ